MAPRTRDITGQRFHKLVALQPAGFREGAKCRKSLWKCVCDCGREAVVAYVELRAGATKSCGCIVGKHKRTHGATGTPEFRIWDAIRRRCQVTKDKRYPMYGGRGIKVCERWQKFENFLADMGPRPGNASVDRIDNNGHYEPSNCRWTDMRTQSNNRRSNRFVEFNGERLTMAEWERRVGLKPGLLFRRLEAGWPVAEALTPQLRQGQRVGNRP